MKKIETILNVNGVKMYRLQGENKQFESVEELTDFYTPCNCDEEAVCEKCKTK